MTLHEAIEKVISDAGRPLSVQEIALEINKSGLYQKGDGKPVSEFQIFSRINNYKNLFKVNKQSRVEITKDYNSFLDALRSFNFNNINSPEKAIQFILLGLFIERIVLAKPSLLKSLYIKSGSTNINSFNNRKLRYLQIANVIQQKYFNSFPLEFSYINDDDWSDFIKPAFKLLDSYSALIRDSDDISFSIFFKKVLIGLYKIWSNFGFEISDSELSAFVTTLVHPKKGDRIYDPFAGIGNFLCELNERFPSHELNYTAKEIQPTLAFIGILNMTLGINGSFTFSLGDSFQGPVSNETDKFDWIVTFPPFIPSNNKNIISSSKIIRLIIDSLKTDGKAVIIVNNRLFDSNKKEEAELRKQIIEHGYLEAIYQLPHGLNSIKNSSNYSVIKLNKSGKKRDLVFGEFQLKGTYSRFDEDSPKSLNEPDAIYIPSLDTWKYNFIKSNNYNLNFNKYALREDTFKLLQSKNVLSISNVIKHLSTGFHIPSFELSDKGSIPYIKIRNLSNVHSKNKSTEIHQLEYIHKTNSNRGLIHQGTVLVANKGYELFPTLYDISKPSVISSNLFGIVVDTDKILPEFLCIEMQKRYFLEQVNSIRYGVAQQSVSKVDFLNLKIIVPDIERQRRVVKDYSGIPFTFSNILLGAENTSNIEGFSSIITHSLKTPIATINSDLHLLKGYLNRKSNSKEPVRWTEDIINVTQQSGDIKSNNSHNNSLDNVYDRVMRNAKRITDIVAKLSESSRVFAETKKEIVNVNTVIHEFIDDNYSHSGINFQISHSNIDLAVDTVQLSILLDNLIQNSIKHGFNEKFSGADKIIKIYWEKVIRNGVEYVEFIIENNGISLPENFNFDKYKSQKSTTNRKMGVGFGGFLIDKIVQNHDGMFELVDKSNNPLDPFQVCFNIYIPI